MLESSGDSALALELKNEPRIGTVGAAFRRVVLRSGKGGLK